MLIQRFVGLKQSPWQIINPGSDKNLKKYSRLIFARLEHLKNSPISSDHHRVGVRFDPVVPCKLEWVGSLECQVVVSSRLDFQDKFGTSCQKPIIPLIQEFVNERYLREILQSERSLLLDQLRTPTVP